VDFPKSRPILQRNGDWITAIYTHTTPNETCIDQLMHDVQQYSTGTSHFNIALVTSGDTKQHLFNRLNPDADSSDYNDFTRAIDGYFRVSRVHMIM
jgi:hypothetical protein